VLNFKANSEDACAWERESSMAVVWIVNHLRMTRELCFAQNAGSSEEPHAISGFHLQPSKHLTQWALTKYECQGGQH